MDTQTATHETLLGIATDAECAAMMQQQLGGRIVQEAPTRFTIYGIRQKLLADCFNDDPPFRLGDDWGRLDVRNEGKDVAYYSEIDELGI